MSTSVSIPATVQIRRGRLVGLVAGPPCWPRPSPGSSSRSPSIRDSTSQAAAPRASPARSLPPSGASAILPVRSVERAHAGPAADDPRLPGRSSHPAHVRERSIGSYLFGTSTGLTPAQLQTIRRLPGGSGHPAHSRREEHRLLPVRRRPPGSRRPSFRRSTTTRSEHAEPCQPCAQIEAAQRDVPRGLLAMQLRPDGRAQPPAGLVATGCDMTSTLTDQASIPEPRERSHDSDARQRARCRTSFPSPFEVAIPPGCEGWEEMYPYHASSARIAVRSRRAASGSRTGCTARSRSTRSTLWCSTMQSSR